MQESDKPAPVVKVDWKKLAQATERDLREQLAGLLQGSPMDLEAFLVSMAERVVMVAELGDAKLLAELETHPKLFAELQRIKAVNGEWQMVGTIVRGAASTIINTLAAAAVAA